MNHPNFGAIFCPTGAERVELPINASVAFKAKGGKFVSKDSTTGYKLALAADGATTLGIIGWCEVVGDITTPAAITKYSVITDPNAIFEMPVGATITEATAIALLFKTMDIKDTNTAAKTVQSVDIGTSTTNELICVGYDVDAQTLYVKLNPAQQVIIGVAD